MVKLNGRIKASTLMESLVAMVIMVVCVGVGTMIYTNVLDSDKQRNQLKAMLLINKKVLEIKTEKNYIDGEEQIEQWTLKRTVEKYEQSENLYKLTLLVMDQDKKIVMEQNELIPVE